MSGSNERQPKPSGAVRWSGVLIPGVIAVMAVTVQWGVVTTKLDHVEMRLDELLLEARALRTEYQSIERRVSYLEGRLNGRDKP